MIIIGSLKGAVYPKFLDLPELTPFKCAQRVLECCETLTHAWYKDWSTADADYYLSTIDMIGKLLANGDYAAARALARSENLEG